MSSGGGPPGRGGGRAPRQAPRSIKPIYKRLPPGPHQLDRSTVIGHQRARIRGAMVETIAAGGYESASVRQVIALAGVSRRSFYELFDNKHACFLETFDAIAMRETNRLREACAASDCGADRLAAAFSACERGLREDPKGASLLLWAIHAAGPDGVTRLCRASAQWELMLGDCLAAATAPAPSAPVLRCLSGALQWVVAQSLRGGLSGRADLTDELLALTVPFGSPHAGDASAALSRRLRERVRRLSIAGARCGPSIACARDEHAQLLHGALLSAHELGWETPSAARIADAGGLSVERFFESFESAEQCQEAALEALSAELLVLAGEGPASDERWPEAVRSGCERVLCHLARRPLHISALLYGSLGGPPRAIERHLDLSRRLGTLLAGGASRPVSALDADAAAGALWHTLRHQLANGRVALLEALPEQLAYAIMVPALGSERAGEMALAPSG